MHEAGDGAKMTRWVLLGRLFMMVAIAGGVGVTGLLLGLESHQSVAVGVFLAIILGTLFFWNFRVAVAFVGVAILILTRSLDVPHFVEAASLPVILFLVGMMIVIGALRDLGFFTWVVQAIASIPKLTGRKFMLATAVVSALLACAVDEVTSIILIAALVFQVCGRLKLDPTPYIIICVLCTNVGSAGTMIGNPVGVYIGMKAGFSFHDFILWSFPVTMVVLAATVALTMFWYRRELDEFGRRLDDRLRRNLSLVPKIRVPYKLSLFVLGAVLAAVASHHVLEERVHLGQHSVLMVAPLVCAGLIMIFRGDRARHYVEREVDWWTLLFFMLLFSVAGTLEYTGCTALAARWFVSVFGHSQAILVPVVMTTAAIGSAFVDNVILVAAYSPVIEELGKTMAVKPLWWALLFGACFGGNITLIGSTANIVALGMLEKQFRMQVRFLEWLKIGALSALVAGLIAWGMLTVMSPFMG